MTKTTKSRLAELRRQYQPTGNRCSTCPETRGSDGQQLRVDDGLYCFNLCRWVSPAGSCTGPKPAEKLSTRIINKIWRGLHLK